MTRTLADAAESLSNAAAALDGAQRQGVRKAALYTTQTIRAEIRRATGGDSRLSGVGRRGARVGARYQIKRTRDPRAEVSAVGPLHLIERDTSPHRIPRKRKRGRKRYVKVDGQIKAYANHPGTRGQRPFEKGWRKAAPRTTQIFRAEVRRAIVGAW